MNCIGLMNQEQSTVYLKHATSVYKYAGVLVQTPLKVLHSNSSCANEWEFMIPSPCYLDDFNELLHALLQKDANSPLTAHEPISNVLGWWIPVLGPVIQWVWHTDTTHSTQTWHGELNRVGKTRLRLTGTETRHTTGAKTGTTALEWCFYCSRSFSTKQALVLSMTIHSIRPGTKQPSAWELEPRENTRLTGNLEIHVKQMLSNAPLRIVFSYYNHGRIFAVSVLKLNKHYLQFYCWDLGPLWDHQNVS